MLQHPDEARHPLNTARLAVLGLQNAEMRVGERFEELNELIAGNGRAMLLFPPPSDAQDVSGPSAGTGTPHDMDNSADPSDSNGPVHPGALDSPDGSNDPGAANDPDDPVLLIVPDGTWRKARRIVQANPVLQGLPRLSLPEGEPSQYRVRKATEAAAVSTIEAIVRALNLLEPERDFDPLLKPFQVLIDQQISAMGKEVFQRNHGGAGNRQTG